MSIAAGALLTAALVLLSMAGIALLAVADPRDRIHFAGPATTFAPFLVAAAGAIRGASLAVVIKAFALAILLAAGSTVVSHALVRALHDPGREGR